MQIGVERVFLISQRCQCRSPRGHGERVAGKGAAAEDERCIVLACEAVHDLGSACNGSDGEAASDGLAVSCEVGRQSIVLLASSILDAEAGNHLVEKDEDIVFATDFNELSEEVSRIEARV